MRRRSAFITGIAGFAGSYLAEELLQAGLAVSGSLYEDEPTLNIETIKGDLRLLPLDILHADRCRKVLARLKPDYIFHLAAMSSVGRSFEREAITFRVGFEGTLNLLSAAVSIQRLRMFLFVGSADAYGVFSPKNKTLSENQPLNPISPYGIAKAAAEHTARYYHRQHGLPAIVVRAFNHSGPRQGDGFVIPSFAKQIAMIEAGRRKPIVSVGDLSTRRDFSDVRDIVRGYHQIAEKGKSGEVYQLCSGRAVSIRKILEMLLSLSPARIDINVDKARLRKSDIPVLRGSNRKAAQSTGFETRYTLKDTLRDTLEYWRERIRERP